MELRIWQIRGRRFAAFCRIAVVLFPDVLEDTTNLIRVRGAKEGVEVKVLPGVSFLDQVLAEIKFDFSFGLQVCCC